MKTRSGREVRPKADLGILAEVAKSHSSFRVHLHSRLGSTPTCRIASFRVSGVRSGRHRGKIAGRELLSQMNRIHVVPVLLSCILLVVVWQLGAFLVGSPLIIPYPLDVLSDALALAGGSDFPVMLGTTIIRGLAAFFISVALSFLVGIPAGMSVGFETAIRPWMAVIRATPVVSLILIALFWFGSSFVPVFVSVLMTMPVMTESIMRGIRSTDSDLLVMSRRYRFGTLKRLRYIRVPSMLPYFSARGILARSYLESCHSRRDNRFSASRYRNSHANRESSS